MPIPAYIIDQLERERRQREHSILDELSIEKAIPEIPPTRDSIRDEPTCGVDDIDFFI